MGELTGKQFYVENVGGAGGNVGTARAAQSTPDGTTILVTGGNFTSTIRRYIRISTTIAIKDFPGR